MLERLWRMVYRLMTVYGLRNHECWYVDLAGLAAEPIALVKGGKTGGRLVVPYPISQSELAFDGHLGFDRGHFIHNCKFCDREHSPVQLGQVKLWGNWPPAGEQREYLTHGTCGQSGEVPSNIWVDAPWMGGQQPLGQQGIAI